MGFKEIPHQQGVSLLQQSLERGRLGHAHLFTGNSLEEMETIARTMAKTLNCQNPVKRGGAAIDCCDRCAICVKIDHGNHGDVHWLRPESKTRIIRVELIRELIQAINLKPTEANYKMAIIVAADRLKTEAANAFLKTLEEPPPKSVLILLSTEPQRLLDTIRSRCLRLNLAGDGLRPPTPAQMEWLRTFSHAASVPQKSLLGRYRLLDVLLARLAEIKSGIEEMLKARSPSEVYQDVEASLAEKWEEELKAAVEAEYRRQRADLVGLLHWWLRDVWLHTLGRAKAARQAAASDGLLAFPELAGTKDVAERISSAEALSNLQTMEQLQRSLHTNVQEALALEVGLLKLHL